MRSKLGKSIVSILLILSMVIPNIALKANAEETDNPIDNHTIKWVPFEDENKVQEYLDGNKVPTESEYLFAGWYTQETDDMDSLKQYALRNAQPNGTTYALFVPKDVLGVKAQVSAHLCDGQITDADNSASIRFVTSVPSLSFREVGLEVTYTGKDGKTEYTSNSKGNTVYKTMFYVGSESEDTKTKPWTLLCGASKYFKAHVIEGVPSTSYTTEFNVKPYWVTLEGDKVYAETQVKRIADAVVQIENDGANGTVTASKDYYVSGDTVTLTGKGKSGYRCVGMNVNGNNYPLENGQVTFTAEAYTTYKVNGVFEKVFADNTVWNLDNLDEGYVSLAAGTTADWLQLNKQYTNIDLTVKAKDYTADTTNARTDVFFVFNLSDGTKKNLSVGVTWNGTAYRINADKDADATQYGTPITNLGASTMYGSGTLRSAEAEVYRAASPEGLDLRLVRIGTDICVYINERLVDLLPLNGVAADTKATVYIRHTMDTNVERVIPFSVSEPVNTFKVGAHAYEHTTSFGGGSGKNAQVAAQNVTDMDLTVLMKRDGNLKTSEKYDIMLDFDLGNNITKNVSFCFNTFEGSGTHKGLWVVTNFNDTGTNTDSRIIFPRNTIVYGNKNFSGAEEFTQMFNGTTTRTRLDFRIKRVGTTIEIYLGGQYLATADVSTDYNGNSTGVTDDTPVKVSVRHYGQANSGTRTFTYRYLLITP